jgi:hypothetical protein
MRIITCHGRATLVTATPMKGLGFREHEDHNLPRESDAGDGDADEGFRV